MTKIALKGSVDGTGSLTLKAPVTTENRELEFSIPAAGQTLAVADASGMPLGPGGDPVVESGSNSDGEWTRWADGTQSVRGTALVAAQTFTTSSGGIYFASGGQQTFNFPVAFIAIPASVNVVTRRPGGTGYDILTCIDVTSTTGLGFMMIRVAQRTASDGYRWSAGAIGRWK